MSELRVITVRVEQGVRAMRLIELPIRDRVRKPAVVGLTGELEDPARHHHGNPVSGELFHERVTHFPGRCACAKYAAARRSTSFSCSNSRFRFRNSRNSAESVEVTPGRLPSSTSAARSQFCRQLSLIPKSVATCLTVTPASRARATRTTSSREEERGDQESRYDEEHVHADEATRWPVEQVVCDHCEHGDHSKALDVGPEPRLRLA